MNKIKKWQCQCMAKNMIEVLNKKHYTALYAENLDDARKIVLDMIPKGSSIALGGSVTINEMNIIDTFRSPDYKLFDRYQKLPFPEIVEIMRQSMIADYLVTGTNAVTKNGELVNMDSSGNRAAGMIFGPKKVIVVVGTNKIVDNIDEAMKRIRMIAPLNCKRIGHKTPCAETGICTECDVHDRMCNYTSIVNNGWKFEGRFTIIMVADEIGF